MHITIAPDEHAAGRIAATLIGAQLLQKPESVLGLATGETPLPTYAELVRMHQDGIVSFGRATTFNLDEYVGLPPGHEQSYHTFMWRHLFSRVNIDPAHTHLPEGCAADMPAACKAYDAAIEAAGGIDLQLLGIGHNGHIGFNEPGETLDQGTHLADLAPTTIQANRRFFADEAQVPRQAITMGMGGIMQARRVLLVACGAGKADIVAALVTGLITTTVPASLLRLHRDAHILVDEDAARKLG
ncbi:MAG: glucosamine-6-phosphate deaminase [Oscillospiraceae bacterium]|jgi:glucosamine-6-phosphate deaminase|nr:glucosamine-6-phosphate deaminase [Oscillospiraceae bacterium]